MEKVGGYFDLAKKPSGPQDLRQLRSQDLDRDLAVMLQVLGEEHVGHTTAVERPIDPVSVGKGDTQPFVDVPV
jgi:hypothetical protein